MPCDPARTTARWAYAAAQAKGLLDPDADSAVLFQCWDTLRGNLQHLRAAFAHPRALHAVAVKTNPHPAVLRRLAAWGFGLEAASFEEVLLARAAGCPADRIVFDSPVKTRAEIAACATAPDLRGVRCNANSLEELQRLSPAAAAAAGRARNASSSDRGPGDDDRGAAAAAAVAACPGPSPCPSPCPSPRPAVVGLRINPLVDAGSPALLAVSHNESKFGVPLRDRAAIVAAVVAHPRVTQLHVHSGSSMSSLPAAVAAVTAVVALAEEANAALRRAGQVRRITAIDIGGGLPPETRSDLVRAPSAEVAGCGGPSPSRSRMQQYAAALRAACPQLWTDFELVTEFGKWTHAAAGFAASRVEYAVDRGSTRVAYVHLGADYLPRDVYVRRRPHECFDVLRCVPGRGGGRVVAPPGAAAAGRDPAAAAEAAATPAAGGAAGVHLCGEGNDGDGEPRTVVKTDIAGPLCFAGDYLAKGAMLPRVEEGDVVLILRTGANSMGLWSRHCSRAIPKVIGVNFSQRTLAIVSPRFDPFLAQARQLLGSPDQTTATASTILTQHTCAQRQPAARPPVLVSK